MSSAKPATVDPVAAITNAIKLLRAGNVQAADAELDALSGQLQQEQAAAAGAAQPKPKRKANVILGDVLQGITALLGNSPAIVSLVEELMPVISEL